MERQEINELTLCLQWERDISGCGAGREKSNGESQLSKWRIKAVHSQERILESREIHKEKILDNCYVSSKVFSAEHGSVHECEATRLKNYPKGVKENSTCGSCQTKNCVFL